MKGSMHTHIPYKWMTHNDAQFIHGKNADKNIQHTGALTPNSSIMLFAVCPDCYHFIFIIHFLMNGRFLLSQMRYTRLEINHEAICLTSQSWCKRGLLQLSAVIDRTRFNRAEIYLKKKEMSGWWAPSVYFCALPSGNRTLINYDGDDHRKYSAMRIWILSPPLSGPFQFVNAGTVRVHRAYHS